MSGKRRPVSWGHPKPRRALRPGPDLLPPPWRLVLVRYCPNCRLDYTSGAERCSRCGGVLVDQEKRIKVEDR